MSRNEIPCYETLSIRSLNVYGLFIFKKNIMHSRLMFKKTLHLHMNSTEGLIPKKKGKKVIIIKITTTDLDFRDKETTGYGFVIFYLDTI